jgi:hypothetical protein
MKTLKSSGLSIYLIVAERIITRVLTIRLNDICNMFCFQPNYFYKREFLFLKVWLVLMKLSMKPTNCGLPWPSNLGLDERNLNKEGVFY